MSEAILNAVAAIPEAKVTSRPNYDRWLATAYGFALLVCISLWLLAVRAPLWTDETLSYWQIAGGFKEIWARSIQGNSFAAYAYILWFTKTVFGDKEIVLRIPSILAMVAAVYVFYKCARELFDWDVALIAAMVFTLPRGIAFAAIDVRPYPFALLVTNLTILLFLCWMKTHSTRDAALFGVAAAGIFYFHYLFASILLALAVYYVLTRFSHLRNDSPQIAVVLGCFALFLLPVLPRLKYIYQTRTMHSFAPAPQWTWIFVPPLQWSGIWEGLNPGTGQLLIVAGILLLAVVAHRLVRPYREVLGKLLLCVSLALVPIFVLYAISVNTSVHVFIPRYLLVAVPGTALCWGWLCSIIDSRALRSFFCIAFVGLGAFQSYTSPLARWHEASWKEALAIADANAAADGAPVLMCSPLVEADFLPMPPVPVESVLYSPLSYYKVNARIVPLPRSLTDEAQRQVKQFLLKAAMERSRFVVLAPRGPSQAILDFTAYYSHNAYTTRLLGLFEDIWVVEFDPIVDDTR
jgi:4-amino-4-deoxy-L-arabinose transferase-like glycosyltransferase